MAEKKAKIIKPQEGFQERFVRTNVDFAIGGGVLNPQPYYSFVATPKGFVRICDLKVGDVVCDTKGGTQKVNFVIDKGIQPCVEFTLSDGRKVYSALSHNWYVKERHNKMLKITTKEIMDYIDKENIRSLSRKQKHTNKYRIPMSSSVAFDDVYKSYRVIHPYVVGYMIGNGCISEKAHSVYISTIDQDVVDYISSLGYNLVKYDINDKDNLHYYFKGCNIKKRLKKIGIYGTKSYNKFIPDSYKYAPIEDRIELLKGLFDSDGNCEKKAGQCSYKSVSLRLINDIKDVIYSLGGIANYTEKAPVDMHIRNKLYKCRTSYELRVRIDNDADLFMLPRKKMYAKSNKERRQKLYLGIESYNMVEDARMFCINVDDSDHLYLTDNYVVTCNCGKSYSAVLSVAEPSLDSRFRGLFLRNNLADARASGGLLDTFKEAYGEGCEVVESGDPRVTFPSGARIDVTHVADQSRDKVLQRFKGRQYDFIYFDEGTGFTWDCFTTIYSRNRGTASWTGKVRMTTNPDRRHWLRKFLDWYIGVDGFIREDREGVVRYFYMNGEKVDDVVWGDSKEEVYQKCKIQIDRVLRKVNGKTGTATYKDMVKSFTFYLGRMSENKASIGNNSGYVGSVAVTGGRNAQQLLEGNWNVSPEEDLDAPITSEMANQVFVNDPRENGDRWVTCDLADTGTDNFLCLAWNGFNIIDCLILGHTTPRQNAERLEMFAAQHDVSNSHIIYDAVRGTYINDYIPEAVPFVSYRTPVGIYGRMAYHLKDECYMRLVEFIKRGDLTMEDRVSQRVYEHQRLKENITIQNEFIEECSVVRFKDMPSGKKTLYSKKEMNANLGKGRSMDLLDPCAMRMLPVLEYPYGEEIEKTMNLDSEEDDNSYDGVDIYNDSTWC